MKFLVIKHIDDLRPHVQDKKEIRFMQQQNGTTVACYLFSDSNTFDSEMALECRGITFDSVGRICSRPLHKFFNLGEKSWLTPDELLKRNDIAGIYEKLDGSMIATAWVDGKLEWRSKKSFDSNVVRLAKQFLSLPENQNIVNLVSDFFLRGLTFIFELTHPEARIVVAQEEPQMRLLHIRNTVTGEYLERDTLAWSCALDYEVPIVPEYTGISIQGILSSLETMKDMEGYVIQFKNGDMVKIKCPWYVHLHRSITFLRERDIARLALHEELDDVKGALREAGIDLQPVEEVETRLKGILTGIMDQVERMYCSGAEMSRKDFAIQFKEHPLFSLAMLRFTGRDLNLVEWYEKKRLNEEFSLRVLAEGAVAEAIEA